MVLHGQGEVEQIGLGVDIKGTETQYLMCMCKCSTIPKYAGEGRAAKPGSGGIPPLGPNEGGGGPRGAGMSSSLG